MLQALLFLVIVGVILWVVWEYLKFVSPQEPFLKIGKVLIGLVALIVIVNFLLSVAGRPFIVVW